MSGPRVKIPVSQAFDAIDLTEHDFLYNALSLVEGVHLCGYLPRVMVRVMPADAETEYRPSIPPHIFVDTAAKNKLSTMIHGIGHVLDQFGFGTGEYNRFESSKLRGTNYNGVLQEWWKAVHATNTVAMLVLARDNPVMLRSVIDEKIEIIPDKDDLAYLVSAEELWARSYLQYITVKTQDAALLAHLHATLSDRTFCMLEQWPAHEFSLIEAQIDALFARLGWRS